MDEHLLIKFSKIKLLAFDLDGVLTNGKLLVQKDNEWLREMDIKDGLAIQLALQHHFHVAVITGSFSEAVGQRLQYLGVHDFFQRVKTKSTMLYSLMSTYKMSKDEVLFMGDDLPDLDAFAVCGLKTCPADAVTEIKESQTLFQDAGRKWGSSGCDRESTKDTGQMELCRPHSKYLNSFHV